MAGRQRKRVCSKHGCPNVYEAAQGAYCPTCRREAEAIRGSARQRGYDSQHDRRRARVLPDAIGTRCPRCGELMLPGQQLQLGHTEDRALNPSARADRAEHARCNAVAGGQVGAAARA